MEKERKCEPEDYPYTSYPLQYKCKHCGNIWNPHKNTPVCKDQPLESIPGETSKLHTIHSEVNSDLENYRKTFEKPVEPLQNGEREYSKNERAERLVGNRMTDGIIIDFPAELDYHCPVCKYEQENSEGSYDGRLDWSEYNGFIYCHKCNRDYPSCLCMPDKEKATKIYLDCIEELLSQSKKEGRRELLDSIIEGVTQLKDLVSMFNPMSPEIRAKQSGEIEAYNGLLEKLSKLTTK